LVHEVLGRSAQAVVRGGARCAPQVLDRDAHADACGAVIKFYPCAALICAYFDARKAARCLSQILDRCAQQKNTLLIYIGEEQI
jgi:hypothetical protein